MNDAQAFAPRWASPPGETIRDALHERQLSLDKLASTLGRPLPWVRRLLEGDEGISIEVARNLTEAIGGTVEFWITRDGQYRDDLARVAADEWASTLPISEMTSLGWIERPRTWQARINAGLSFYGVPSLDEWNRAYGALVADVRFRVSDAWPLDPQAVAAWLRKAELEAQDMVCRPWDPEAFTIALRKIRELTRNRDPQKFLPELVSLCAEAGVVVVVLRAPRGCPVSGAARFLAVERAQIVLSARYLADDHFWFTFLHEAGHLLRHERRVFVDQIDRGETHPSSPEESDADQFASSFLLPETARSMFAGRKRPTAREIAKVARSAGVAPGIVVGQLQHDGVLGYATKLNGFKHRYKWVGSNLERA